MQLSFLSLKRRRNRIESLYKAIAGENFVENVAAAGQSNNGKCQSIKVVHKPTAILEVMRSSNEMT